MKFYQILNKIKIFFFHKTVFHAAVQNGNVEVIQLLLTRNDIDLNAVDEISFFDFTSNFKLLF